MPSLSTSRLQLRKITNSDLHNIYIGLSHPEVIPYYGVSYDSIEATKSQLQWYQQLETDDTGIVGYLFSKLHTVLWRYWV